jgi:hypothetical protein
VFNFNAQVDEYGHLYLEGEGETPSIMENVCFSPAEPQYWLRTISSQTLGSSFNTRRKDYLVM